jgi:hypothetical protein
MRRDLSLGGLIGLLAGIATALIYHQTGTPAGTWGTYVGLNERINLPHPGWWPSVVVIPLAFLAGGLVVAALFWRLTRDVV